MLAIAQSSRLVLPGRRSMVDLPPLMLLSGLEDLAYH